MEGITGALYRRVHADVFGGADRYYAPFIYANPDGHIGGRDQDELLPENNQGLTLIPQILSNHAESFIATAKALADMGYTEVNLNLGCPSKKVSGRGRGAGFLAHPRELEDFLEKVYTYTPVAVSIKTRIGVSDEEEFESLLAVYERFPVKEMIIHPRLRDDYYKGPLHPKMWEAAAGRLPYPLCYNGDLFRTADISAVAESENAPAAVMAGRGVLADPALLRTARGGRPASADELREMHELLFKGYRRRIPSDRKVLSLMKEHWQFWRYLMSEEEHEAVNVILHTTDVRQYMTLSESLFSRCFLLSESQYGIKMHVY